MADAKQCRSCSWGKTGVDYRALTLNQTPEREKYLDFTPILLRAPQVIITRESSETVFIDGFSGLSGKVLAVVKGFKTDELIQNQYPSIKPLYVKNVMEALRAVSDGRADAAADSLLVVNESVRREGLTNLRVSGTTHHYDEYRIGIRSDDPILASIIRKAVRSLSTEELNAVYNKWISIRYTTEVDYGLILRIALAGVLLLLVIVYWNHRLRGEVRMRKEMARRIGIVEKRTRRLYELDRQTPKLSERQVCERAVDIAVELSDSQVGYLHLIDADQQHLTLTAWNGEARKYCTASYDTHYPVCEAGVWADSLREMRTVIHNDYPKLESARGIPEGHFPVTRHMSTPAIDGDLGRLIIGVGNKEVPYEKKDAEHLEFIAGEILKIVLRQRAEQALKLARIEAEKANRAKSMFLANMSHELRTPLNAVLGFSQLLADDPSLGAGQRTHVDVINRSGQHLLQLINDVLDMSKIESGKMSLEIVDMDLSALVRETVDLMRGRAGDKGLSLHLDQAPGFPQVIRGDGPKIRQILINLLGNAIKFTRNGSVSLHLDAEQETFDRITLLGEVRDTGQGIDAADLERIFQPFEQLLAAVEQKGTGLGLAITRQFVELMNGEISVESTPGQGSTFRFTLLVEPGRRERVEAGAREISRQVVGIADP
ncbi:MAG: ATP-binding protein, partial [Candidatus Sedimenticola endophacoides]